MRTLGPIVVLTCFVTAPGSAVGQEPFGEDGVIAAMGQVVDRDTGAPIEGAYVAFEGQRGGVYTDARGRFLLRDPKGRSDRVTIEMLGYGTTYVPVTLLGDAPPVRIPIRSDPVILEGIEVVADRFERRRNASPASVRMYDERRLRGYQALDVVEFIEGRTFLREVPCGGSATMLASPRTCVRNRGRTVSAVICIDEVPALGGLQMLRSVSPADLYLLEVYRFPITHNVQVRLYTRAFMEGASRRRFNPMPAEYGC